MHWKLSAAAMPSICPSSSYLYQAQAALKFDPEIHPVQNSLLHYVFHPLTYKLLLNIGNVEKTYFLITLVII